MYRSVACVKAVNKFPNCTNKVFGIISDIRGTFTTVPFNHNFPNLFACDNMVVRKMVSEINQTKSHGQFWNQSSDGQWEICFHLFWYSETCISNHWIVVQRHILHFNIHLDLGKKIIEIKASWSRSRSCVSDSMWLSAWVWVCIFGPILEGW